MLVVSSQNCIYVRTPSIILLSKAQVFLFLGKIHPRVLSLRMVSGVADCFLNYDEDCRLDLAAQSLNASDACVVMGTRPVPLMCHEDARSQC